MTSQYFVSYCRERTCMRTFVFIGFAVILGVGLGIAGAMFRINYVVPWYNRVPTSGQLARGDSEPEQQVPKKAPKAVVVGSSTHDFGVMESDAVGKHVFEIRNEGDAPLRLRQGVSTCKCTVGLIGAKTDQDSKDEEDRYVDLPPGGSTPVTIEWKTKGFKGDFLQTATFKTDDVDRPELNLNIKGRVLAPYVATPPELVFSSVPAGEGAKGETKVLGYRKVPFEVLRIEFSEAGTSKFFEVTHEPLSADEVKKDKQAHNGRMVRVAVKPGLPSGPFRQTISLITSTEKDASKVEIPIQGLITSQLSIIGAGWNEAAQMLVLGTVPRAAGTQQTLRILARGPHRKEVKFKPVKMVPEALQVSVGETTEWQGGQVTQTPVTISIPKGSPLANYLGPAESNLGQITLETNHPAAPQLRILVRFAIAD